MDELIKKKLARNWFKTLQEVFCQEIEELEGKSNLFEILTGKEEINLVKEEVNFVFIKMVKFLKKLV